VEDGGLGRGREIYGCRHCIGSIQVVKDEGRAMKKRVENEFGRIELEDQEHLV
jgi:hypothetical protein